MLDCSRIVVLQLKKTSSLMLFLVALPVMSLRSQLRNPYGVGVSHRHPDNALIVTKRAPISPLYPPLSTEVASGYNGQHGCIRAPHQGLSAIERFFWTDVAGIWTMVHRLDTGTVEVD